MENDSFFDGKRPPNPHYSATERPTDQTDNPKDRASAPANFDSAGRDVRADVSADSRSNSNLSRPTPFRRSGAIGVDDGELENEPNGSDQNSNSVATNPDESDSVDLNRNDVDNQKIERDLRHDRIELQRVSLNNNNDEVDDGGGVGGGEGRSSSDFVNEAYIPDQKPPKRGNQESDSLVHDERDAEQSSRVAGFTAPPSAPTGNPPPKQSVLNRQKTLKQRFQTAIEKRTFKFYFQHPLLRILVAFIVSFFNFMIYLEDPVPHSQLNAHIPVVGHAFSLVLTKYPSTTGMVFFKILCWTSGIGLGLFTGLLLHHLILRRFLPHMFRKSRGSWFVMFITTLISVFIMSAVYSAVAGALGEEGITSDLGIRDELFMKLAATGTWLGDLLTFCMVFDLIMQDAKNHKAFREWAPGFRAWWNSAEQPYRRIVIFWSFILITTVIVLSCIYQPYFKWDDHVANWYLTGEPTFPNNQVWRIALASVILSFDLLIVMQDWTFPGFEEGDLNLKLPGLNKDNFIFEIYSKKSYEAYLAAHNAVDDQLQSRCNRLFARISLWVLEHLSHLGEIEITGKWFNYGILCIVMILDLNMLKNQIVYDPKEYCQYTIEHNRICVINDLNPIWDDQNFQCDPLNMNYNSSYCDADPKPKAKDLCYCPFGPCFTGDDSRSLPDAGECLSANHTKLVSQFTPGLGFAPGLLFLIPVLPAIVSMIVVLKRPDWDCLWWRKNGNGGVGGGGED